MKKIEEKRTFQTGQIIKEKSLRRQVLEQTGFRRKKRMR